MQKTRHPITITSKKAYNSQQQKGNIQSMQNRIMKVMERLKFGSQESIAKALNVHPSQVWRRLSELERCGNIIKTNISVRSASTGELQAVYCLPKVKLKLIGQ